METMLRRDKDRLVIRVTGRLDERGADLLQSKLASLDLRGAKRMDLDLAGVTFIGSAGLGGLLAFHHKLDGEKVTLNLIQVPQDIFKLMQSMKLDKVFQLSPR